MENNSPTPRTDRQSSEPIGFYSCSTVPASFARQLERELAQIRSTLQNGLDRDKDDTTTAHLAVVAVNALARSRHPDTWHSYATDPPKEEDGVKISDASEPVVLWQWSPTDICIDLWNLDVPQHVHWTRIQLPPLPAPARNPKPESKSSGVDLIAKERQRQIEKEGWTPEHDDTHTLRELARAAICYATPHIKTQTPPRPMWPWHDDFWKPSDDPIRNLVKAGALIVAEIDRLQRKTRLAPAVDSDEAEF
jgi:hypothetical protein